MIRWDQQIRKYCSHYTNKACWLRHLNQSACMTKCASHASKALGFKCLRFCLRCESKGCHSRPKWELSAWLMQCHMALFSPPSSPMLSTQSSMLSPHRSTFNVQPSLSVLSFWWPFSFFGIMPRIFQPKGQIECNHWYICALIILPTYWRCEEPTNGQNSALHTADMVNGYNSTWKVDVSTNRIRDTVVMQPTTIPMHCTRRCWRQRQEGVVAEGGIWLELVQRLGLLAWVSHRVVLRGMSFCRLVVAPTSMIHIIPSQWMNTASYICEDVLIWSEALHATAVNILVNTQILMITLVKAFNIWISRGAYIQKRLSHFNVPVSRNIHFRLVL